MAAIRVSNTLVGFGNTGSNTSILDAVSPVSYNVSNSLIDRDYVDLAWKTGGVAFNIDLLSTSLSALTHFTTLMYIWGDPGGYAMLCLLMIAVRILIYNLACFINLLVFFTQRFDKSNSIYTIFIEIVSVNCSLSLFIYLYYSYNLVDYCLLVYIVVITKYSTTCK